MSGKSDLKTEVESAQDPNYWTLLLMEESAEVIQIGSKILRFGIGDNYKGKTNRELLEFELKDVLVAMKKLMQLGYLNVDEFHEDKLEEHHQKKKKKLEAILERAQQPN